MDRKLGAVLAVSTAMLAGGCASDAEHKATRTAYGEAALAEAGAGAKLLSVCGPFMSEGDVDPAHKLPAEGKFMAIVERADESLFVRAPFTLIANPPLPADPDIVAVDQNGRPLPSLGFVRNTQLKSRSTSPGQVNFTAVVWRADANGAPVFEDREVYEVSKTPVSNKARATVDVDGKHSTFVAECG
ncbi:MULTISPECIES: hypothetical protein [unclassified Phenylobacterium]|uniref:hypothetical protein n=1 Tax=unclassified Phenylobacterium TaxID=2640670 RepID=UPI0012E7F64E|nr:MULTISPECIES: hypothetical protein [unclassified Phenylobacterium]